MTDLGRLSMLLISNLSDDCIDTSNGLYFLTFYKIIKTSLFLKANPNYSSTQAKGTISSEDPEVLFHICIEPEYE